jgi:hypothetical protein
MEAAEEVDMLLTPVHTKSMVTPPQPASLKNPWWKQVAVALSFPY